MKARWWWWVLASTPAVAGAVSLVLDVGGDFRSSGMLAGVSASIGLTAVILLLQALGHGRRGSRRWVSFIPGLVLGLVSVVGLTQGLPEFLQARGLFVSVDSVGPVRVFANGSTAVIVGNDGNGGLIWTSEDGTNWTEIDDPQVSALRLIDGTGHGSLLVVAGQSDDAEAVVLVSEDGRTYAETARFGHSEHGALPRAIARHAAGLLVVSDIYGNDVEFYESPDSRTWVAVPPAAIFDDGESARDVACSGEVCVAVGTLDAAYRPELEANAGVAWISRSGSDFQPVNDEFDTESLDAIAATASGFIAVAASTDGRGLVWQSPEGAEWHPVSGPFNEMVIDGVDAIDDGTLVVFGHDPVSGDLLIWSSDDDTNWTEATVAAGLSAGSQLRSVTGFESGLIAVGIDAETLETLVWTSLDGGDWREAFVLSAR